MRTLAFATALATSLVPGLALAHTSLADHAHPHGSVHPYLGIETLAILAVVAVAVGTIGYVVGARRGARR